MNDKWYFSTVDVSQIFSLLQIVTNYFKVLKFEKRSGIFASKNYPVFSTFTRLTKWHRMTQKKSRTTNDISSIVRFSLNEASGTRTPDNLIKSQVLYHLS